MQTAQTRDVMRPIYASNQGLEHLPNKQNNHACRSNVVVLKAEFRLRRQSEKTEIELENGVIGGKSAKTREVGSGG